MNTYKIRLALTGSLAIEGEGNTARYYLRNKDNRLLRLVYPKNSAPVKPSTEEIKISGNLILKPSGLYLQIK